MTPAPPPDRWFKQGDRVLCVPAGRAPGACGVDLRMAVECGRPPEQGEQWIGRRWALDRGKKAAAERQRAEASGALIRALEAGLADVARRLAALEAGVAGDKEGREA